MNKSHYQASFLLSKTKLGLSHVFLKCVIATSFVLSSKKDAQYPALFLNNSGLMLTLNALSFSGSPQVIPSNLSSSSSSSSSSSLAPFEEASSGQEFSGV